MGLIVSSAPTKTDILSVDDAKAHLRIPSGMTDDDSYIGMLIGAVYNQVSQYLGRPLLNTTYTLTLPAWPTDSRILLRPTLQSITSVKYYDNDNSQQTLATSKYNYDAGDLHPYIKLLEKPAIYEDRLDAVEVIYVSGYGASDTDVPGDILLAVRKLVATHYQDREDRVMKFPSYVKHMLSDHKNWSFENN